MVSFKNNKLFQAVYKACVDKKGIDICVLDLTGIESYTNFMVIVSGGSDRQVKAVADNVLEEAFKKCKEHPLGTEGYESGHWVLIDFGDVVCHVFDEEYRDAYHLEHMWPKASPMNEKQVEAALKKKAPAKKKAVKKVVTTKKVVRRKAAAKD
jgi:ribosome-associated protein